MRMIAGLEIPTDGEIKIDREVTDFPAFACALRWSFKVMRFTHI
jgi:ABC-type Fe3+/spermidine/putrescine transport system ATPase subunit